MKWIRGIMVHTLLLGILTMYACSVHVYVYRYIQVYLTNEIPPPEHFVWKLCKPFPTIFGATIYENFLQ